jgi:hypothetical protein
MGAAFCHSSGIVSWSTIGPLHTISVDIVAALWTEFVFTTAIGFVARIIFTYRLSLRRITFFDVVQFGIILAFYHHGANTTTGWFYESKNFLKDTCTPPQFIRRYEAELCGKLPRISGRKGEPLFIWRSSGTCAATANILIL